MTILDNDTKLRGQKLNFLRKKWGFTQALLVEDEYWIEQIGQVQSLDSVNAISIKENGGRGNHKGLSDQQLSVIANAFRIPLEILCDHVLFQKFIETADLVHKEHVKHSLCITLKRIYNKTSEDIIGKIQSLRKKWEESDYLYNIVENESKGITSFTVAHYPLQENILEVPDFVFILLVSIHFNAGWEKWTLKNANIRMAVPFLLKVLMNRYDRVSYRIYYALQYFNEKVIEEEINSKSSKDLDQEFRDVIRSYVFTKTSVDYIKLKSKDKNNLISDKANAVLSEILTRWKDKSADLMLENTE